MSVVPATSGREHTGGHADGHHMGTPASTTTSSSRTAELHPFEIYFQKNWDSCTAQWCAYERQSVVTFGNNTNNRLWSSRVHRVSIVQNAKYDREISVVANVVSEHACNLIFEEYDFVVSGRAKYLHYESVPGIVFVQNKGADDDKSFDEPNVEYAVTKYKWECSCFFMVTRLLPCRHVFYLRKALDMELVIPTYCQAFVLIPIPGKSVDVRKVVQMTGQPWNANRKYREAHVVARMISDTMSGMGMPHYRAVFPAQEHVALLFKHGDIEKIKNLAEDDAHPEALVYSQTESNPPTQTLHADPANDSVTELSISSDIHDDADPGHNIPVDTLPIPGVTDPVYMPSPSNDGLTLTSTDDMGDQPTEVSNQPTEVDSQPAEVGDQSHEVINKPVLHTDEIVRILPKDILQKCYQRVTALQKTRRGMAERDVTVEICSIGVFSTEMLRIMERYNRATTASKQVEKAVRWISSIAFTLPMNPLFKARENPALIDKLHHIKLLTSETEVLDLAAKGSLSDITMSTLSTKWFGSYPTVAVASRTWPMLP
ncbi:unnamed protein product [Phytophthora fragariaefolia]|uniref:Unnamed protein product n=1 Tax=Phytophthora fragariaefolia TaxID=1490495 RepID=A0A9W7D5S6_9STRA|nr:unnamed protein product [Phytophthora fragariaefolia]